jgi:hypothetical protein
VTPTPRTLLLTIFVASTLGACTSLRQPAAKVASSGIQTTATCMASTQKVRTGLDTYVEAGYLRGGLLGLPDPPVDDIDRVRKSLGLRMQALQALQEVYQEYEKFAVYDAEADVRSAAEALREAINGYAASVPGASPLPAVASALAVRGLELIARADENRRLKQYSQAVRSYVEGLLSVVKKETVAYQGIAAARATTQGALAQDLLNRNLSCPHPILSEYASGFGLEYDRESLRSSKSVACDSAKVTGLHTGIKKIINGRVQRQIHVESATLAQQESALESLISAHRQLESDQDLTLDGLRGQLFAIRQFAEELREARSEDQSREAGR